MLRWKERGRRREGAGRADDQLLMVRYGDRAVVRERDIIAYRKPPEALAALIFI
jgi:hypothetical protein